MRITLEPTIKEKQADFQQPKVIMEMPFDDLSIYAVIDLFKGALIAYGFSENLVNRIEVKDNE